MGFETAADHLMRRRSNHKLRHAGDGLNSNGDGSTIGGHLRRAIVRPTLELMLTSAGALERRHDEKSGLALIAGGISANVKR